jgi:amidohydrolase
MDCLRLPPRGHTCAALLLSALSPTLYAAPLPEPATVAALIKRAEPGVVAARRHIHAHPELGNREVNTAAYVAARLRELGYEVTTGVGRMGVVGVLRGGRPGPVVALRAELDALPVTEAVDLPFKSTVRTRYEGQNTGVMHACGHDAHAAILLGTAEVLRGLQPTLTGTVKLIFQPAEEGAPTGEEFGARLMVKEGVLTQGPAPEVIFGLHVMSMYDVGTIAYRSGGLMAGSDDFEITVHGRQTHAAMPWNGVDPIVIASQIVLGMQTVASRQMDVTKAPTVITVGRIEGGIKSNIIPDTVTMIGTVRAFDPDMLVEAEGHLKTLVEHTAQAAGGTAQFAIAPGLHYAVTYNEPELTARMTPTLVKIAGEGHVIEAVPITGGEDFSAFQEKIPGLFVLIGGRTPGAPAADFPPNHSPKFRIDEKVLPFGVRLMVQLTLDYMSKAAPPTATTP